VIVRCSWRLQQRWRRCGRLDRPIAIGGPPLSAALSKYFDTCRLIRSSISVDILDDDIWEVRFHLYGKYNLERKIV
jgi:hypothetical protein